MRKHFWTTTTPRAQPSPKPPANPHVTHTGTAMLELTRELLNGSELAEWARAERPESKGNILLYFTAKWCQYCTQMTPIVREVARRSPQAVIHIDITHFEAVGAGRGVQSVPAFHLISPEGETIDTRVGSCPKKELLAFLTQGEAERRRP